MNHLRLTFFDSMRKNLCNDFALSELSVPVGRVRTDLFEPPGTLCLKQTVYECNPQMCQKNGIADGYPLLVYVVGQLP